MKPQFLPAVIVLTGAVGLSFNTFAADANEGASPAQPVKAAPSPHSHVQEKYGVASKTRASENSSNEKAPMNATTDPSKHFHPRDR